MRYLVSVILPPLGVAMCKRWGQFILNLIFCILIIPTIPIFGLGFFIWVCCIVHALIVCKMSSLDKRVNRIVRAIQAQSHHAPAQQQQA